MTLRNLTDALTLCGLDLPAAAAEWIAVRDALHADAAQQRIEHPSEVIDALTADNAPEYVTRLTTQRVEVETRKTVCAQLAQSASARAARAISDQADGLIAGYRKQFDAAAETLTRHAAAFPPGETGEAVLARGAQTAWAAIADASTVLDAGLALWSTLYERPPVVDAVIATYDGDHWRRVDAQTAFEQHRWHALVAAGYPLRLNTRTETLTLIAATPERELRWSSERQADGFVGHRAVRA